MALHVGAALAAEAEASATAKATAGIAEPATAEQIAGWIKSLDDENFSARQQASQKLFEAGAAAIEPLVAAASGDSLEVTSSSVEVLRRMLHGEQPNARTAAKAALEKLSKSDHKALADRATAALKPPAKPTEDPTAALGAAGAPIIIGATGRIIVGPGGAVGGPGGIIIGGGVPIAGGITVRTSTRMESNTDGSRTIEVQENDNKVRITEGKAGIKVVETKTVDGKETSQTYEAKTADELKEKQPEGFKLYEKYAKPTPRAAVGRSEQQQAKAQLTATQGMLDVLKNRVNALKDAGMQKSIDKIEQAQKLLEEAAKDLGE